MVKPYNIKKKNRKNRRDKEKQKNQKTETKTENNTSEKANIVYTKIRKADNLWIGIALAITMGISFWTRLFSTRFNVLIGYDVFYFFRKAQNFVAGELPEMDEMIATVPRNFRADDTMGIPWVTATISRIFNIELFTVYEYFGPFMAVLIVGLIFALTYLWWKNKYLSVTCAFLAGLSPAVIFRTTGSYVEKDTMGLMWAMLFFVLATLLVTTKDKRIWMVSIVGIPLTMMAYVNTFGNFFFIPISIGAYLFIKPLFEKETPTTVKDWIQKDSNIYILVGLLMVSSVIYVLFGVPAYELGTPDVTRVYLGGVGLLSGAIANLMFGIVKNRLYYLGILVGGAIAMTAFVTFVLGYNFLGHIFQSDIVGISGQRQNAGLNDFNQKFYILWPISIFGALYGVYKALTKENIKSKTENWLEPKQTFNVENTLPISLYGVWIFLSVYMLRNTFFGGAFIAIMAGYTIYALYDLASIKSVKYGLVISLLALGTIAPLTASNGIAYSQTIQPHTNEQWQEALEWIRTNTPEDEVICNWWDYGYWMQTLGERRTISDGMQRDQQNWIGGFARFLASTEEESLKVLEQMEKDAYEATGNEFKLNYVVVDPTMLIKTTVLNTRLGEDVFRVDSMRYAGMETIDNRHTYYFLAQNYQASLVESQGTFAAYLDDLNTGARYGIRDVVIEFSGRNNSRISVEYQNIPIIEQTMYFSTIGLANLIPERLEETMFIRMIVYEDTELYELVFDNGYVKIYKVIR